MAGLKLTLIAQGATRATRLLTFPLDEPLEPKAEAKLPALAQALGRVEKTWASPALAAQQMASLLGLKAKTDPALRGVDYGAWAGKRLEDVQQAQPEALALWMRDPAFAPPDGEALEALLIRVRKRLKQAEAQQGKAVMIAHTAWLRAAVIVLLDANPSAFWRIDVAPLSCCRFSFAMGRWAVQAVNEQPREADAA